MRAYLFMSAGAGNANAGDAIREAAGALRGLGCWALCVFCTKQRGDAQPARVCGFSLFGLNART